MIHEPNKEFEHLTSSRCCRFGAFACSALQYPEPTLPPPPPPHTHTPVRIPHRRTGCGGASDGGDGGKSSEQGARTRGGDGVNGAPHRQPQPRALSLPAHPSTTCPPPPLAPQAATAGEGARVHCCGATAPRRWHPALPCTPPPPSLQEKGGGPRNPPGMGGVAPLDSGSRPCYPLTIVLLGASDARTR